MLTMFDTAVEDNLRNEAMLERLRRIRQKQETKLSKVNWPAEHLVGADGHPVPFHAAQRLAWESTSRYVTFLGGSQAGKTSWGPWWMEREIRIKGRGDYIVATASYDLFKLKLLPAILLVFEQILKLGRFWAGDKIFELKDPLSGKYWATKSTDPMWARIILRSAQSEGGLESSTAKAVWLDEAGQDEFTIDAWRAVKRRGILEQARVLLTTTLYSGMTWIKTELIDKAEKGGVTETLETDTGAIIDCIRNDAENICIIQADSTVNPMFSVDEYEEARRTLPPDQFAMFYRGRIGRPRHMIYDCLDENRHFIPSFKIPDDWIRYVGVDFGGVNTVATYWAEDPKSKKLYCYRYYKGEKKSAKEHVDAMLEGEPMRPIAYGGAKAEGQWRQEFREGGLSIKEPKIPDVWLGINRTYSIFKQEEAYIFDELEDVKYDLLNYRRKTDNLGNATDEIVEKNKHHVADGCRYILPSVKREHKVQIEFA